MTIFLSVCLCTMGHRENGTMGHRDNGTLTPGHWDNVCAFRSSPPIHAFCSSPPVSAFCSSPQVTGTLGHQDTRTPGHWDTGTLGHQVTSTLRHCNIENGTPRQGCGVPVPTYRNCVSQISFCNSSGIKLTFLHRSNYSLFIKARK